MPVQYFYILTMQWPEPSGAVRVQTISGVIDAWDSNPQVMFEDSIKALKREFNVGGGYVVLFYRTEKMT